MTRKNSRSIKSATRNVTLVGGPEDGMRLHVLPMCFEARGGVSGDRYAIRPIDTQGNAIGVHESMSLESALNMVLDAYAKSKDARKEKP